MKLNTIILSLLIVFSFILTGCEKKEIFGHKTVYGEATINGKHLVQYAKAEESLANQFWYLPLGGNVIAIEDDICYLQMMLRDNDWNISLTAYNIFNSNWDTSDRYIHSPLYAEHLTTYGTDSHARLNLSVTYTFGYGKKVKRGNEVGKQSSVRSAIMK